MICESMEIHFSESTRLFAKEWFIIPWRIIDLLYIPQNALSNQNRIFLVFRNTYREQNEGMMISIFIPRKTAQQTIQYISLPKPHYPCEILFVLFRKVFLLHWIIWNIHIYIYMYAWPHKFFCLGLIRFEILESYVCLPCVIAYLFRLRTCYASFSIYEEYHFHMNEP